MTATPATQSSFGPVAMASSDEVRTGNGNKALTPAALGDSTLHNVLPTTSPAFEDFRDGYLQQHVIQRFDNLSGSSKWMGGVLAPNGKIYGIPHRRNSVLEISVAPHQRHFDPALLSGFTNHF